MPESTFDAILDRLRSLASRSPVTRLRPEAFFVARSGVLTLAFRGFPTSILDLKNALESTVSGLVQENPGSLWPKTTLAALAEERMLSTDEIVLLREATNEATVCVARDRTGLVVDALELVELYMRSMERVGRRNTLPFSGGHDDGKVPASHRALVYEVLHQWRREGLSRYVPDLARSGYRAEHYRSRHHEWSLVIPVGSRLPCLDAIRESVESRLPGRYAWFEPASLHVTVRSLGTLPGS